MEKKEKHTEFRMKYAKEMAQLEADGIHMKNKWIIAHYFEKANGDPTLVKQWISERQEKHRQRKEYRRRHDSSMIKVDQDQNKSSQRGTRHDLTADELEDLKRLRLGGIGGNPKKVLAMFHQCNNSIEMIIARKQEDREQRCRQREERLRVRQCH
jgi:hypothetical protein